VNSTSDTATSRLDRVSSFKTALAPFLVSRLLLALASWWALRQGVPDLSAALAPWDGGWYRAIATTGYEFAPDGNSHNVAFFPLFPLMAGTLARLAGVPFALAGSLLNQVAFLGALLVLHGWVRDRHGSSVAIASVWALALAPCAGFTAVAYTEGLYLLFTTACLAACDRDRPWMAALFGALASATRVTGCLLAPAIALAALGKPDRGRWLAASLLAPAGLVAYMTYQCSAFGDPLAFVHAQHGWRSTLGFDASGWLGALTLGLAAPVPFNGVGIAGSLILAIGMLVRYRDRVGLVATTYALLVLLLLLSSGSLNSFDRYLFGLVPVTLGIGFWLAEHPRLARLYLVVSAILMVSAMVRLLSGQWVA
jgi:hypothetical protein